MVLDYPSKLEVCNRRKDAWENQVEVRLLQGAVSDLHAAEARVIMTTKQVYSHASTSTDSAFDKLVED